jgi:Golgi phosphoprotein 3
MQKSHSLPLYEEIMLLALRDEEGTVQALYTFALGGAVLAELMLLGRVSVDESKKRKLARVVDSTPIGDPLLDEALGKLRDAKRAASLETWVTRFANIKQLKHRVAGTLCRKGILKASEDKVLLLFTRKIYPELDPKPERELVERMRQAIFGDSKEVDPRTVVVISIANSAGILRVTFDKKRLKARKERIERIVNGELTGKAAAQAIQSMQVAIMVACIIPTVITPTIVS